MSGLVVEPFDGAVSPYAVGQAVLDRVRTLHPDLAGPADGGPDEGGHRRRPGTSLEGGTDGGARRDGLIPHVFEVLRDHARQVEAQLLEPGYMVALERGVDLTARVDDDGDVLCHVCAVIDDDGAPLIIDLELPVVAQVIGGGGQRPLADRVRVAGELVCFYSQAIRFVGGGDRGGSGLVRGFGEAVGVLGDLLALAREHRHRRCRCPSDSALLVGALNISSCPPTLGGFSTSSSTYNRKEHS